MSKIKNKYVVRHNKDKTRTEKIFADYVTYDNNNIIFYIKGICTEIIAVFNTKSWYVYKDDK